MCDFCKRNEDTVYNPEQYAQAGLIYHTLMTRIRRHVKSLRTVQFDETTGVQRFFFNGKLEKVVHLTSRAKGA
jgi:hypothetical protein